MKIDELIQQVINEQESYFYPDAGKNAPSGVQESIQQYHELSDEEKKDLPLLYFLLGDGTPPYKMSPEDAEYIDESSNQDFICGNCEYLFQHTISGDYICSKIRGEVQYNGWCRLWDSKE